MPPEVLTADRAWAQLDLPVRGLTAPIEPTLRESGSLEQDVDVVNLVHRPDAWDSEDSRAGEADLIVAKHRNGETRTIPVAHQLHYSRFTDLAAGM